MFDDEEHKANRVTRRGQNVDNTNIALAFNVCQSGKNEQRMVEGDAMWFFYCTIVA